LETVQQIFVWNTRSGAKRGLLAKRYLGCVEILFPVVLQLPETMYFFPFKWGAIFWVREWDFCR